MKLITVISLVFLLFFISCKHECADSQCLNGGTCMTGSCQCAPGFYGDKCQYKDSCYGNTCKGNGTCKGGNCNCYPTFWGNHCEKSTVEGKKYVVLINNDDGLGNKLWAIQANTGDTLVAKTIWKNATPVYGFYSNSILVFSFICYTDLKIKGEQGFYNTISTGGISADGDAISMNVFATYNTPYDHHYYPAGGVYLTAIK